MKRDTLLVIDDEEINRLLLAEIFKDKYKVIAVSNGAEAIDKLNRNMDKIAAIILDLEMPVMNGFAFLENGLDICEIKGIPIVVVTADSQSSSQLRALDYGVADVILKPYRAKLVRKRLDNIISLYNYKRNLEYTVEEQTSMLQSQQRSIAKANENLIEALSSVVESRDIETGEHILRIKEYTKVMCMNLLLLYPDVKLTRRNIDLIVSASAMHDIGKIGITDTILLKPGPLTEEEFEIIKTHTTIGAKILETVNFVNGDDYYKYCRNICLYHHEKIDGKGYPYGLKGDEIPLEAQIVSLADVFDALTTKRVYKDAYTPETARRMILDGECGAFSERILRSFEESFDKFKDYAAIFTTA